MTKAILLIINIFGGVLMMFGLLIPFMAGSVDETTQLVMFLYFMGTGFVLWYVTAKRLEGVK